MPRKLAIALLALSALAHWPLGATDFTYDDKVFIESNASIRSFDTAFRALLAPFPPEQPTRGLYRPLTNLTYAVEYALFGTESYGYHVVNVLLYIGVVWLVYGLARSYFCAAERPDRGGWLAFAAALLFSVHPVHGDAVDSLAGRSELLALGFTLAALLVFLRMVRATARPVEVGGPARPARRDAFACALLYALGCASKETAVLLPAVAGLHLFAMEGTRGGLRALFARYIDLALPLAGVALLYLALRLQVLGGFGPAAPVLAGQDMTARLATTGAVYLEYARLLFFPDVLAVDYYYQQAVGTPQVLGPASLAGLLLAAVVLGAVAAAAFSILRAGARAEGPSRLGLDGTRGLLVAGLGSAIVLFLPVSHVVGIGALLAERFLFSPSVGIVLCAVGLAAHWGPRVLPSPRVARALGIAMLVALSAAGLARSHTRAREWRDGVELWLATARLIPDDYRVHANLAAQWIARERLDEAEASLQRALEIQPDEESALVNLGAVYIEQERYEEARAINLRVVEAHPRSFVAWMNLGVIASKALDDTAALEYLERAAELNPNHEPTRVSLAATRERIATARRFRHDMRSAVAESEDPKLLTSYARACRVTGDFECAERFEARARRHRKR